MPLSCSGLQYQPPAAITVCVRMTGSVLVHQNTCVVHACHPLPPVLSPLLLLYHQLVTNKNKCHAVAAAVSAFNPD